MLRLAERRVAALIAARQLAKADQTLLDKRDFRSLNRTGASHPGVQSLNRLCSSTGAARPQDTPAAESTGDGDVKADTNGKAKQKSAMSSDEVEAALDVLRDELHAVEQARDEFKGKYMRSLADAENVRSRMMRQVDDAKVYSIQNLCKDLVEVPDILEAALDSVPAELLGDGGDAHLRGLYDGVRMTRDALVKTFTAHGLERVAPLGEPFDPNFHEALFQVPDDKHAPGTVVHLGKVGYRLHARPVRAAQVGVAKAP